MERLVTGIEIRREGEERRAVGGVERRIEDWRPADEDLTATRFRCVVRS